MSEPADRAVHTASNHSATEMDDKEISIEENNSDMDILETRDRLEYDMCEDDVLKHISYQILDRIEFEHVGSTERDALCRIIMNRGLMNLKEGKVTSAYIIFVYLRPM